MKGGRNDMKEGIRNDKGECHSEPGLSSFVIQSPAAGRAKNLKGHKTEIPRLPKADSE